LTGWAFQYKCKGTSGENDNIGGFRSDVKQRFPSEKPNKTKPPLQVLAVAEGNSEKNKVWDEARDRVIINRIKHKIYLLG
jgi:hypothetical protein